MKFSHPALLLFSLGSILLMPTQVLADLPNDQNSSTIPNNNNNTDINNSSIERIRERQTPLTIDRSQPDLSINEFEDNSSGQGRLFERREQRRRLDLPNPRPCSPSSDCNF